jgi:hypothetical protein
MRRLEEVLHDLAEQDERLPTSELITRIERGLSGEGVSTVATMDGRSAMDAQENTRQDRRRMPMMVAAGAALLVLIVVGLPILLFGGGDSEVVGQPTTTVALTATTVPPTSVVSTSAPTPITEGSPSVQGGCPAGSTPDNVGPFDLSRPEPGWTENQGAVFDVGRGRIVYVDSTGETWTFDVCTNSWQAMHADTTLTQPSGSLVYDIDSDRTISFGSSVAVYDANTNKWTPASMPSPYNPGLPFSGDAVYSPISGLIIAQHGQYPGVLVEYDVDTDTWTTLGEVNEGAARFLIGYQTETDQLVFQGYTGSKKGYVAPSGMLVDPRSLKATPINTTNHLTPDVSGGFGSFAYATGTDTPYIYTGDQQICRLDPATQQWDVCFNTADGPGRGYQAFAAMVGDPINNRLVLINGVGGQWWAHASSDIWAIDLDTGEWTRLLAHTDLFNSDTDRWTSPAYGTELSLFPPAVEAVPGEYTIQVDGSGVDPMAFYVCPKLQGSAQPDADHENVLPNCEPLQTVDNHTSDDPSLPRMLSVVITDEMIADRGVTIASMGGFGTITGTVVLDIINAASG